MHKQKDKRKILENRKKQCKKEEPIYESKPRTYKKRVKLAYFPPERNTVETQEVN